MSSKDVDIYRDTPVRLLGYANEVGESFRALVNVWWVRASYGVSSAYVLADTRSVALRTTQMGSSSYYSSYLQFSGTVFLLLLQMRR